MGAPGRASAAPRTEEGSERRSTAGPAPVFEVEDLSVSYGPARVLREVTLRIERHEVTALIGPSGCGKTTFLRCLNRMNDLVPEARVEGRIRFDGTDLYDPQVRAIELRRRIGMVFQRANPFPKSIYDNVAIAPKMNGTTAALDDLVEASLQKAALWDEVKDKLRSSAYTLSGGQQQRLCIARAIAVSPEVILMDEPCSALDPAATSRIEDLMVELTREFTIVVVTHDLREAARVADRTAFFSVEETNGGRAGVLVEAGPTEALFNAPVDARTRDYLSGRTG